MRRKAPEIVVKGVLKRWGGFPGTVTAIAGEVVTLCKDVEIVHVIGKWEGRRKALCFGSMSLGSDVLLPLTAQWIIGVGEVVELCPTVDLMAHVGPEVHPKETSALLTRHAKDWTVVECPLRSFASVVSEGAHFQRLQRFRALEPKLRQISASVVRSWASSITSRPVWPWLRELNLEGVLLGRDGALALTAALDSSARFPNLATLNLSGALGDEDSAAAVLSVLGQTPSIEELLFRDTAVGTEMGARILAATLPSLPNLTHLDLAETNLSLHSFTLLIRAFVSMHGRARINCINVTACDVGSDGVELIKENAPSLPSLKFLITKERQDDEKGGE